MPFPVIPNLSPALSFDREEINDFFLLSIAYKNMGLSSLYNGLGSVLERSSSDELKELAELVSKSLTAANILEQALDHQLLSLLEASSSEEE